MTLDDFVICGHVNPDGDCLGSQLAFYHALRKLGKRVTCVLAKPDPIDVNLRFLPGIESMVPAAEFTGRVGCFLSVDVPTVERMETAGALHDAADVRIALDHHASDKALAEYAYVDPDSPSASMIAWDVVALLDAVTPESALCAMTGLFTDTGRFAYQNTTTAAFLAAAAMMEAGADPALICREVFQNRTRASLELERIVLERMQVVHDGEFSFSYLSQADFDEVGAIKADTEPLVNLLRSVSGVRVALILREVNESEVRGSLRAKDDTDVSVVARSYGGGGHRAAAGFTFKGSLEAARIQVPAAVEAMCLAGEGGQIG